MSDRRLDFWRKIAYFRHEKSWLSARICYWALEDAKKHICHTWILIATDKNCSWLIYWIHIFKSDRENAKPDSLASDNRNCQHHSAMSNQKKQKYCHTCFCCYTMPRDATHTTSPQHNMYWWYPPLFITRFLCKQQNLSIWEGVC